MQKTQLTGGNPTLEAAGVEKGGDIAFARRNVCSNAIGANAKLERSGSGYDRLIHTRPPKIHWRDDVLLVRLSLIFSVMSIEICFSPKNHFLPLTPITKVLYASVPESLKDLSIFAAKFDRALHCQHQ